MYNVIWDSVIFQILYLYSGHRGVGYLLTKLLSPMACFFSLDTCFLICATALAIKTLYR